VLHEQVVGPGVPLPEEFGDIPLDTPSLPAPDAIIREAKLSAASIVHGRP
jgi:hypothetical protein